jgi:hypothetical protein
MSARTIQSSGGSFQPVTVQSRQTSLTLSQDAVHIRKNGVEFRSEVSIAPWTEMTVTLQPTRDSGKIHCNGVVVACNGNRHAGYIVSMVFTSLSKQSQERLNQIAYS